MPEEMNKDTKCNCGLKPDHHPFYHDWCCQICGGSHVEGICPEKNKVKNFVSSMRFRNMLLGILNMMLILGVFLLGHNSAYWTNTEIEKYCMNYNLLPKNGTGFDYYGNPLINITGTTIQIFNMTSITVAINNTTSVI
jgi:hypothetical protein